MPSRVFRSSPRGLMETETTATHAQANEVFFHGRLEYVFYLSDKKNVFYAHLSFTLTVKKIEAIFNMVVALRWFYCHFQELCSWADKTPNYNCRMFVRLNKRFKGNAFIP